MSKLVRDKIPDIINAEEGVTAVVRFAKYDERIGLLIQKLYEEIHEYHNATSQNNRWEELADIQEVLQAIAFEVGSSPRQIEEIRRTKFDERGGFNHAVILLDTVGP